MKILHVQYYDDAYYTLTLVGILLYEGDRATLTEYTIPPDEIENTVSVSRTIALGSQYGIYL